MSFLYSVLGFVVMLGVLVFVHEWGHYITGRLMHVKVLRFSIGFGPIIWRRQRGETEWALSALPLGGYVKFLDEREGPVPPEEQPRAFNRQPAWKRILIVFAGPFINLVFAWLVFSVVFLIGFDALRPVVKLAEDPASNYWIVQTVDQKPVYSWGEVQLRLLAAQQARQASVAVSAEGWPDPARTQWQWSLHGFSPDVALPEWLAQQGVKVSAPPLAPVVGQVQPGTPAETAGLKPGDRILQVGEAHINTWEALVAVVQAHPGETLPLLVMRNGETVVIPVRLGRRGVSGAVKGFLGVGPDLKHGLPSVFRAHVHYSLAEALALGLERTWTFIRLTGHMVAQMVTGQASLQNLSGPISIAQFSGEALQSGWVNFLMLMGLLSLSLGLLNLLPIPLLDGGHLLFDAFELLTGRPISENAQLVGQKIGMALILLLTFIALTNDLVRLLHD